MLDLGRSGACCVVLDLGRSGACCVVLDLGRSGLWLTWTGLHNLSHVGEWPLHYYQPLCRSLNDALDIRQLVIHAQDPNTLKARVY